jgi:hypothetical protein
MFYNSCCGSECRERREAWHNTSSLDKVTDLGYVLSGPPPLQLLPRSVTLGLGTFRLRQVDKPSTFRHPRAVTTSLSRPSPVASPLPPCAIHPRLPLVTEEKGCKATRRSSRRDDACLLLLSEFFLIPLSVLLQFFSSNVRFSPGPAKSLLPPTLPTVSPVSLDGKIDLPRLFTLLSHATNPYPLLSLAKRLHLSSSTYRRIKSSKDTMVRQGRKGGGLKEGDKLVPAEGGHIENRG